MGDGWERTKRITAAAFRPVRGRDLSLHAAAITFYGAIAVVPVALLAIWLTGLLAGADRVRRLTGYAIDTLPTEIGAHRAAAALVEAGLGLTPLLAPAPALLLSILLGLPLTTRLVRQGGWVGALGVVLSFLAVWLVLTPVLIWVFRVVGPASPDWLATVALGSFTAANLSGFLHGFVLFCSLPLDLGVPFGGFDEIGGGVAVLLWLYLFHVIVLSGYSATLAASRWRAARVAARA
ncbi:hypothetical protein O7630_03280 [Micromonospora sp. WMMD718]|uniref:ribonuclease BN n=1 Tax=unclassified Micromonospora TaxID=2617518 RepID=UPI00064BC5EC|nr:MULTISPECIES: ribonuclease BN [unclassified Micromonospora]MDG4749954.1 hypothetical protein [Micromonospora sp. WMMD718]